jgi:hypothetical protein
MSWTSAVDGRFSGTCGKKAGYCRQRVQCNGTTDATIGMPDELIVLLEDHRRQQQERRRLGVRQPAR